MSVWVKTKLIVSSVWRRLVSTLIYGHKGGIGVSDQHSDALNFLRKEMGLRKPRNILSFEEYSELVQENPRRVLRSISQLFYDMVNENVQAEEDNYVDDRESIGFVRYDCSM